MPELNDQEVIAEAVRTELARQNAENNKALGIPETAAAKPIVLNILGQTHTFATQADADAALSQTFQRAGAEMETLKAQLASRDAAPAREGGFVSGKENDVPAFSQEKYIKLMGEGSEGILEAQKYALNHAIFGGKEGDATAAIRRILEDSAQTKSAVAVYQFRELHPEFPINPQAAQVVDALRKELNQPFTLEGLEAAYGVAQARGLVPSPQLYAYQQQLINQGVLPNPNQNQNQNPNQNQQQQPMPAAGAYNAAPYQQGPTGFAPPPTIGRASAPQNADLAALAEDMPLPQLEAILRKQGLMK